MKKWVFTVFQSSLSGPTLEPCRSAGREAVFCLRGGNRCPSGSQVHQPCWGCPQHCAGPGLPEGAVRWLMEWEQDLRFHGRICYLACSFAVLVITSISDIVKVIWALPCYGLLALGGKTGKADEGSLWVLKWLCVCVLTPGRERHKCFSLLPST